MRCQIVFKMGFCERRVLKIHYNDSKKTVQNKPLMQFHFVVRMSLNLVTAELKLYIKIRVMYVFAL